MPTESRTLVVVRLGKDHRIHAWLGVPRQDRTWDLALSLYDDVHLPGPEAAEFIHHAKGGKWDGLSRFFGEFPEVIDQYDYFWLVDDDIEATPTEVAQLFDYSRRQGFDLAQPALSLDSYYSHRLTLHCPGFAHRHTNFVELMAPVLSRHLLRKALPMFGNTRSGHGMDWMWQRFARDPKTGVAIIDAVAVRHYRPLRQHLAEHLRSVGIRPQDERQTLVQEWTIEREHAYAFAAKLKSGTRVISRTQLTIRMLSSYWHSRRKIKYPSWTMKNYIIFGLKHLLYRPRMLSGQTP